MSIEDKIRGVPFRKRLWNDIKRPIWLLFPFYDEKKPESIIYAKSFHYTFVIVFVSALVSLIFLKDFPSNQDNAQAFYLPLGLALPYLFFLKYRKNIPSKTYHTHKSKLGLCGLTLMMIPYVVLAQNFGFWLDRNPQITLSSLFLLLVVSYLWGFFAVVWGRLFIAHREYL